MKTLKKTIYTLIITLGCMSLVASCSKEPQATVTGQQKTAAAPSKNEILPLNQGGNTLGAVREGQYVNLHWTFAADAGTIQNIEVIRNATGTSRGKRTVASVAPGVTSFKDSLPDENAYWYWARCWVKVSASSSDAKFLEMGPVKVNPDRQGAASYTKPEDSYKVDITRTDGTALIKWDFPDEEYKLIQIARYTTPDPNPSMARKNIMEESLAGKSQFSDVLPDPDSDYWYWVRITLNSGAMIYKGPIKAEYIKTRGR